MTSQINPSNIDGTYPVAGQDNNSQGFRTNFTNTVTNFQYAKNEITDLQNKAVLKTALTGTTLDNDMQGSPLSNALLSDMAEVVVSLGTVTTTVPIDYSAGPVQTVTLGSSCSLSFTEWPVSGTAGVVTVQVTVSNTAYTLTLPAAVGSGSSALSAAGLVGLNTSTNIFTFTKIGTYTFEFSTIDAGTTIYVRNITGNTSTAPAVIATQTSYQTLPVSASSISLLPIVYNSVSTNTGNNYNSSTGIFTATVPGYYQVSADIGIDPFANLSATGAGALILYKTGNAIASGPFVEQLSIANSVVVSQSSLSTTVDLNVGDTLQCKLAYSTTASNWTTETNLVPSSIQICWLRSH